MRVVSAFVGLIAFAFVQSAAAAPVSLAPVSYSAEFQTRLEEDIGAREGELLSGAVERALSHALARRGAQLSGGAPVTVEVQIIDARPNRPTFEQLGNRPGLSYIDSVSTGGAELSGIVRAADGRVLAEVSHRDFSRSLADMTFFPDTWQDARRAIRGFARKVASAYAASTPR